MRNILAVLAAAVAIVYGLVRIVAFFTVLRTDVSTIKDNMATKQAMLATQATFKSLVYDIHKYLPKIDPEKYKELLASNPAPLLCVWPAQGQIREVGDAIEIAPEKGTLLVISAFAGTVSSVEDGTVVVLYDRHPGWSVTYKNLPEIRVKPGEKLKTRQVIGTLKDGIRLRFELMLNSYSVNPLAYLPPRP